MKQTFRSSLSDRDSFTVVWELVPGRGAREKSQEIALKAAEQAAQGNKVHAVTITDNPGGNPAILADYLGMEILNLGIEPLVHFSCKDKNRHQIESQLYALDRAGIHNLLILTGDYPEIHAGRRPKPVFDLDSTHTLELISEMNEGLEVEGKKNPIKYQPTNFYAGAAVSPFKATEAEQLTQYYKLEKKIAAGAQFIITQLGYDARKFHEALQFLRLHNFATPILGNIYILPFGAAKVMNENLIPGCVVPDKLLAAIKEEKIESDKGLEKRLLRGAKMYAIMKGMGFSGVHLGGHNVQYDQVEYIINRGEEFTPHWQELVAEFDYPIPGGFYYFEKDKKIGLNTDKPVNREALPLEAPIGFTYKIMRVIHSLLFVPGKPLYRLMRYLAKALDGSAFEKPFHKLELLLKVGIFDCKDCGDCALPNTGYVCPMSQCPKNQRNGPCGGSYHGWCEVTPDRQCIYVRSYSRLKKYGEEEQLRHNHLPPCNWNLHQTSGWKNFYLERDHAGCATNNKIKEEKK
ncbi:MAG: methylenetetrahydrofolate reductase C-terminal domain-containing protein [Bacillota bacterium]|nr:methylenetetrahydrofolate reductase C-terminal domain-containing protein [Bacillota bacterium]